MSNTNSEHIPNSNIEQTNPGRLEAFALRVGIVIAECTLAIGERVLGRGDEHDQ